jgi:hypothetical protein
MQWYTLVMEIAMDDEERIDVIVEKTVAVIERPVRVRVLPNGNMDPPNAAKYIHRRPHTLAQWRCEDRGPPFVRVNGRIFYPKAGLDKFMAGRPGRRAD